MHSIDYQISRQINLNWNWYHHMRCMKRRKCAVPPSFLRVHVRCNVSDAIGHLWLYYSGWYVCQIYSIPDTCFCMCTCTHCLQTHANLLQWTDMDSETTAPWTWARQHHSHACECNVGRDPFFFFFQSAVSAAWSDAHYEIKQHHTHNQPPCSPPPPLIIHTLLTAPSSANFPSACTPWSDAGRECSQTTCD